MRNFSIKTIITLLATSLIITMYNIPIKKHFIVFGIVSFIIFSASVMTKTIKKPLKDFAFIKGICLCLALFILFYVADIVNWLALPSLILLSYSDIIGNYKEYLYRIYKSESIRIKRLERHYNRKKENEAFKQQLRNLYHEKDGRRLYIADI